MHVCKTAYWFRTKWPLFS